MAATNEPGGKDGAPKPVPDFKATEKDVDVEATVTKLAPERHGVGNAEKSAVTAEKKVDDDATVVKPGKPAALVDDEATRLAPKTAPKNVKAPPVPAPAPVDPAAQKRRMITWLVIAACVAVVVGVLAARLGGGARPEDPKPFRAGHADDKDKKSTFKSLFDW